MTPPRWTLCALLGLALMAAPPALAEKVRVAMAANFQAPMAALAPIFEAETGHELALSTGATGLLYAQIAQGAPFDVFLAADRARPEAAVAAGLALAEGRLTYATGRLILLFRGAPPPGDPPSLAGIRTLSIANPKTAPYGAAALEVLARLDAPQGLRIAHAQSVAGVNAALDAGAADAGFAALASVTRPGAAAPRGWLVPQAMHAPLVQEAVLLAHGRDNAGARALLGWLASPPARAIIRAYGYDVD